MLLLSSVTLHTAAQLTHTSYKILDDTPRALFVQAGDWKRDSRGFAQARHAPRIAGRVLLVSHSSQHVDHDNAIRLLCLLFFFPTPFLCAVCCISHLTLM